MNRRQFGTVLAALVAGPILPALARGAAAQDNMVRVEGKVAWIAAEKMVVAPPGGLPVTVDLSQVDLDQYRAVLAGDWVIVTGTVPLEGGRVIARSVQRVER
jgi:hypothetical protein